LGRLDPEDDGMSLSGDILGLVTTINDMINQLAIFVFEMKKVAGQSSPQTEVSPGMCRVYCRRLSLFTLLSNIFVC
jgi:hypothetical protein